MERTEAARGESPGSTPMDTLPATGADDVRADGKNASSVTERRRVWAVPASPLNGVKFELGVIVLVAPLFWLVSGRLTGGTVEHLMVLGAFGIAAAARLIWSTHRAMRVALAKGVAKPEHEAPRGPQ